MQAQQAQLHKRCADHWGLGWAMQGPHATKQGGRFNWKQTSRIPETVAKHKARTKDLGENIYGWCPSAPSAAEAWTGPWRSHLCFISIAMMSRFAISGNTSGNTRGVAIVPMAEPWNPHRSPPASPNGGWLGSQPTRRYEQGKTESRDAKQHHHTRSFEIFDVGEIALNRWRTWRGLIRVCKFTKFRLAEAQPQTCQKRRSKNAKQINKHAEAHHVLRHPTEAHHWSPSIKISFRIGFVHFESPGGIYYYGDGNWHPQLAVLWTAQRRRVVKPHHPFFVDHLQPALIGAGWKYRHLGNTKRKKIACLRNRSLVPFTRWQRHLGQSIWNTGVSSRVHDM